MSRGDVSEVPRATELLGRALQGVPMPSGTGAETVFARAARVRWRRRWVVTGVAAAVAAVSLAGTGALPGHGSEQTGITGLRPTARADRLAKLLPPGIGTIREYLDIAGAGPYDGFYAVYKDSGVGYLNIQVFPGRREDSPVPVGERCPSYVPGTTATCVAETLPNGDERESTELTRESGSGGTTWGPKRSVRLFTKGYVVMITAGSGVEGKHALGPRLDAPPLTADQLRAVVMAPELLP